MYKTKNERKKEITKNERKKEIIYLLYNERRIMNYITNIRNVVQTTKQKKFFNFPVQPKTGKWFRKTT